jgi:hypothetical protein
MHNADIMSATKATAPYLAHNTKILLYPSGTVIRRDYAKQANFARFYGTRIKNNFDTQSDAADVGVAAPACNHLLTTRKL